MNKVFLCILFFPTSIFSQQCSFDELISFCTDYKKFEQKMFSLGNTMLDLNPLNKRWEYHINDTVMKETRTLFSDNIPTNDLDLKGVRGYEYTPFEIKYCKCFESYYSHFAENHNEQTKQASTWYWFKYKKSQKTVSSEEYKVIKDWESYSLQIEFVRNTDYNNILKKVQLLCKYVETHEMWGGYWSKYTYKQYKVQLNKSKTGRGNLWITFYNEKD